MVHVLVTLILLFGWLTAGLSWSSTHGVLFVALGGLMLVSRTEVLLPRAWTVLAAAFALTAFAAFLPAGELASWREALAGLGVDTGTMATSQPRLSAETAGLFLLMLAGGLWLSVRRVETNELKRLATGFVVVVAVYALLSFWKSSRPPVAGQPEVFGFFPNRNHTATLLSMGSIIGLAAVLQSIRDKRWAGLAVALPAAGICLAAVLAGSESRAGLLLTAAGAGVWALWIGRHGFGRHGRKALALVALAVIGGFLIADTRIKERLERDSERWQQGATEVAESDDRLSRLDFRIPVWRDALRMIAGQPWTGVGAGNFGAVAPQYREHTIVANESEAAHPESDWLWLAAECGVPAALCLLALVLAATVHGIRAIRHERARVLRAGCLVAALVVAVHGIFDVPGHRVPLAWAAAWLYGIALPFPQRDAVRPSAWPFRLLALPFLAAGIWLLATAGDPARGPVRVLGEKTRQEVQRLYREDQAQLAARAEAGIETPPAGEEDRLEQAIGRVDAALAVLPLDRGLWHWKGFLAQHYDDRVEEVERAFAIEGLLDPGWVGGPLRQARAWSTVDAGRTAALWREALSRADRLDRRSAASPSWRERTQEQIRAMARGNPALEASLAEVFRIGPGE